MEGRLLPVIELIFITLICLLYYVAKAFCDKIWYRPNQAKAHLHWINEDWLLSRGKYSWDKRTFWTKYVFSFIADGWHFFDALRNLSFILIVVITLTLPFYWIFILWFLGGVIFETVYNVKGT